MRQRTLQILVSAFVIAIFIAAASPSLLTGSEFWLANRAAELEMGAYVREIREAVKENRRTGAWGERVEFDSRLVAPSLTKSEAEANLLAAKFERTEATLQEPSPPLERTVDTYTRIIGGLPCNTRMHVYLLYDEKEQLVETSGAIFEAGCL